MQNRSHGEILRSASRTAIKEQKAKPRKRINRWKIACKLSTLLIPDCILSCFGMKTASIREAWREKVTLCIFISYACGVLGFFTYGMNRYVCKGNDAYVFSKMSRAKDLDDYIIAKGAVYKLEDNHKHYDVLREINDINLTSLFPSNIDTCKRAFGGPIIGRGIVEVPNLTLKDDKNLVRIKEINFSWADIAKNRFIVIGAKVYDPTYCTEETFSEFIDKYGGKDGTAEFEKFSADEKSCFCSTFYAGDVDTKSYGCLLADFFLYLSTVAIFGLILTRFVLATVYSWYTAKRTRTLERNAIQEPRVGSILFVTCYSEGVEGLKGTLDSLCTQEYSYDHKLIMVIADGIIKGDENDKSTPEILLDLIDREEAFEDEPVDYIALSSGEKRHNRAIVYTGHYRVGTISTRIILIIKVGNPTERIKPGNRGKRDSQVIMMGFFSRLIYRDRVTPLDLELYKKMKHCMPHVRPEFFEIVLMVDADTIVRPDALAQMVRVFESDTKIMGMTGETKINNKAESWVTMIQVFEYYISHHLTKSFESVFGGVTCLPGCFSSYRIQSFRPKNKHFECMPLLAHPFILNAYSVYETKSLHQKNLLLLGEDRYLTTLLLKTFYKRKLIFLPAARCETQVPAQFKVLLSQRRRWINSTVHNLFELVVVDKLCGTFCCSMQFVVLMELIGTLVLPVAILFTFVLLAQWALGNPAWIPIIMLFGILGLPVILIGLTTGELSYIFWIVIYILSLPIWNFVLPTYSFWHFDDFSWGETRKVQGEDKGHTDEGTFDHNAIKLQSFEDVYPDVECNIVVGDDV